MSLAVRVRSGVTLLVVLLVVPLGIAQDTRLQAATDLYEKHEYKAAQEALLKVDRDALTDAERAKLDELLKVLPDAINANAKATQDLTDADAAFEAGNWQNAERLYQAVEQNLYAPPGAAAHAAQQRARIVEKTKLAEAAKPSGTVEGTVVTETAATGPAAHETAEPSAMPPAEPPPGGAGATETEPRRLTLHVAEGRGIPRDSAKRPPGGIHQHEAVGVPQSA